MTPLEQRILAAATKYRIAYRAWRTLEREKDPAGELREKKIDALEALQAAEREALAAMQG